MMLRRTRTLFASALVLPIAIIMAVFVMPQLAYAAVNDEIHYTVISPSAVTFDWRGASTDLRYGLDSNYGSTVTAHTLGAGDPYVPYSSTGPWQEAKITGLTANTTYHYSIGGSTDQTFTTIPAVGDANFTVVAEGDIGGSLEFSDVPAVQAQVKAIRPSFALIVGDLTYGNSTSQPVVDSHFNDVMAWSLNSAYMPTWGNHEWDKSTDNLNNYKGRFDLPNPQGSPGNSSYIATGGAEDWYWFDSGNTRFIAYPEPYVSATWTDWNTKVAPIMAQAQSDPRIKFIVTFGHYPAYSSGYHNGDAGLASKLGNLGATYSKYVLNINGHSHNYERTVPQSGVTHITSGGGGSELEQTDGGAACSSIWRVCPAPSYTAVRFMRFGVLKLSFSPTAIKGEYVCGPAGGGINDVSCNVGSVIDTFTINAAGTTTPPTDNPPTASVSVSPSSTNIGSTVVISATANDADATPVSKVELYDGNTLLTTLTSAPYTYSWNTAGVGGGTRTITAKAYDTAGLTTSATAPLTLSAGCTVPTGTIGDATMQLSLPVDASYKVWARMSVPDTTNNSFYLQVDDTNCGVVVGDKSIAANAWTWVNYRDGTDTSTITMNLKAGLHTVKLYGRETGVKIDRVVFLSDTCVPVDQGYNCASDDTALPTVSITSPASSSSAKGTVAITATAADTGGSVDKGGVSKVEFYVDSQLVGSDTSSPYSYSWDSTKTVPGTHALTAKAYDIAGNIGTSSITSVIVSDQTAPAVSITAPVASATVKNNVTINASATDNVGVTKVEYILDGNALAIVGSSTVSPYTVLWDSNAVANGTHSLQARAYDAAGNITQSTAISVSVNNDRTAPSSPTNLAGKAVSSAEIDLSWGASQDNAGGTGLAGYYLYRNGLRVGGTILSLSYQDTTVTSNTSYQYTVAAIDNAGNISPSSQPVTLQTPAPSDTTPPDAPTNLVAKADNAAQVTLTWNPSTASDVEGYFVRRNGVVVGQTTSTSYVDTAVLPGTSYSYVIIATDTANNASQPSNAASVTTPALADTTKPTAPSNLAIQATNAQVNLSWAGSLDNNGGSGLKGYNIYRNNIKIASTGLVMTYGDATVTIGTTYAYRVTAFDAAGNESGSSNTASVTISMSSPLSDTAAPTVNITAPQASATVSGNVTASATASDGVGVTKVEFYVDNTLVGSDLSAPYGVSITSSQLTNSYHILTAKAYDASNNVGTGSSIWFAVNNQASSSSSTITTSRMSTITGSSSGSGTTSVLTFAPSDDAEINAATPDANLGTSSTMGADSSPIKNWLMKFDVSGLNNRRVVSAKIQLRNDNASDKGGDIYSTTSAWSEKTVTWRNAPATQSLIASFPANVVYRTVYQVDISTFITTDGSYSLRVTSTSSDGSAWSTKETSSSDNAPKLIVTVEN